MVTVFILEKHIRRQFFEYTYKVKLAKFQLPSLRRSAVTNENSLGGAGSAPPPGKIGLSYCRFQHFNPQAAYPNLSKSFNPNMNKQAEYHKE